MVVQKELFGESKHIEFKEEIPKKHEKELELMGQQLSYDTMRELGENYDPTAAKQLMDGMYQKALDACRNESEREEVHPLTLAKLEDFGILCKDGKEYAPTHAYTLLTKGCSIHELHDPDLEYPETIEW